LFSEFTLFSAEVDQWIHHFGITIIPCRPQEFLLLELWPVADTLDMKPALCISVGIPGDMNLALLVKVCINKDRVAEGLAIRGLMPSNGWVASQRPEFVTVGFCTDPDDGSSEFQVTEKRTWEER